MIFLTTKHTKDTKENQSKFFMCFVYFVYFVVIQKLRTREIAGHPRVPLLLPFLASWRKILKSTQRENLRAWHPKTRINARRLPTPDRFC